jgi:aldose sugar dehydrogenase
VRSRGLRTYRLRAGAVAAAALVFTSIFGFAPANAQFQLPTQPANTDIEFEVITTDAKDPTQVEVTPDGRVFYTERTGRLKIWHPDGSVVEAGRVGVDSKLGQCNDCAGGMMDEGGLHGMLLAKDFADTGHIYLYYSAPDTLDVAPNIPKMPNARGPQETESLFRLSRFTLVGEQLDLASEEVILENPAEAFHCCHYGGEMEWLDDGTLLLTVGDDTISSESNGGYSPRDPRPGKEYNSADLTSQNLADRRGKLLRLDPEDVDGDGSIIPTDNPFLDNPDADPFVYAYGFRSDYRMAVDPLTQKVIVSTVGPDARFPHPLWGPAAHEELEIVPVGGGTNHGWPRCIANNLPYMDYRYQGGAAVPTTPNDCTGMTPAAFYYTYQPSPTNPWIQMGQGGDAIIAGAVYRYDGDGALKLPDRFQDHFFFMDWSRGGVWSLPINEEGNLETAVDDLWVVGSGRSSPIDAVVGPDGALYIAEYGGALYNGNAGKISRIKCAGCQPVPSDYVGSPSVVGQDSVTASSVAPILSLGGPALIALLAGSFLVIGIRRRRKVTA